MAQLVQRIWHMAGGGSSTKAGALKKAGWHRPGTTTQHVFIVCILLFFLLKKGDILWLHIVKLYVSQKVCTCPLEGALPCKGEKSFLREGTLIAAHCCVKQYCSRLLFSNDVNASVSDL